MNVTQRVTIDRVIISRKEVEIFVVTLLINDEGRVVGSEQMRAIRAKEPEGNWGNEDIEAILRKHSEVVQQPHPGMPAVDEIKDLTTGQVLRPALEAVPPREAVWKPTFGENVTFAWA